MSFRMRFQCLDISRISRLVLCSAGPACSLMTVKSPVSDRRLLQPPKAPVKAEACARKDGTWDLTVRLDPTSPWGWLLLIWHCQGVLPYLSADVHCGFLRASAKQDLGSYTGPFGQHAVFDIISARPLQLR